jgi:hypothetical protein
MSTARRIYCSTIACVLLAFAMTSAATARALQDLRSPDARDAAQTPGMSETTSAPPQDLRSPDARRRGGPRHRQRPRRDLATSLHRPAACGCGTLQAFAVISGGAARGHDGRQTAAAHARPLRRRHRLGRRRHWRREPARRDRPRARGRHHDPAAQAPGAPDGDCRLTPRAQHRRERGAGMSGPAPRRDAVRRRSRRKAQSTEPVSITPAADERQQPPDAARWLLLRRRLRACPRPHAPSWPLRQGPSAPRDPPASATPLPHEAGPSRRASVRPPSRHKHDRCVLWRHDQPRRRFLAYGTG